MTQVADVKSVNNGFCVEFSKVEIPLSVKKALFDDFKRTRPQGIDLTDEEVQEMVNEVRYGNKYGKMHK